MCDAWQAGNQDVYFTVTGHWIETMPNGDWKSTAHFSALLILTHLMMVCGLEGLYSKLRNSYQLETKYVFALRCILFFNNYGYRLGGLLVTMPQITG